jgi:predicted TIM-barrel fold metal-dependent hydrolase
MVEQGISKSIGREEAYPHSPDVYERETSDGGFSKGWGMHFAPSEKYWVDVHTHAEEENPEDVIAEVGKYLPMLGSLRVKHFAVMLPELMPQGDKDKGLLAACFSDLNKLKGYLAAINKCESTSPMLYLNYRNPDPAAVIEAAKMGVCGIKLHNASLIMDGGNPDIWLSGEWRKVFETIQEYKLPVLWHVTQRLTDCPYTGGGRNSYWKVGWEKGVKYNNEDLLQIYLKVVEEFPGINFVSAHQLHIGWDRLTSLFDRYKNLYTDTTIGCFVREDYEMYDSDREYLRDIFVRYCDRILFGTDTLIKKSGDDKSLKHVMDTYKGHIRFIRQLRLPEEALQKISHENTERLYKL